MDSIRTQPKFRARARPVLTLCHSLQDGGRSAIIFYCPIGSFPAGHIPPKPSAEIIWLPPSPLAEQGGKTMKNTEKTMDKIVALCKNRGFAYPGCEI